MSVVAARPTVAGMARSGACADCGAASRGALATLMALAIVVPPAFSPSLNDVFALPKLAATRLAVAALVMAWSWRGAVRGRMPFARGPLDVPLAAFLAANGAAALAGASPRLGWSGWYGRYQGLATLLTYALLFWLAQTLLAERHALPLLAAVLAGAGVAAAYACLQHVGLDPLPWQGLRGRAASTLGHPITAGALFACAGVLSLGLYPAGWWMGRGPHPVTLPGGERPPGEDEDGVLKRPGGVGRWLARGGLLVGMTLCAVGLLYTYTRGAWLAAVMGMGAVGVAWWRRRGLRPGRRAAAGLALVPLALLAAALAPAAAGAVPSPGVVARLAAAGDTEIGSTAARLRLRLLESGLRMALARPILGWGPDAFGAAFPRFKPADYTMREGLDVAPTKAHNHWLQLADTTGLVGLATYLWLLGAAARLAWRRLRPPGAGVVALALAAALLAYVAQSMLAFEEPSVSWLFWLLLALLALPERRVVWWLGALSPRPSPRASGRQTAVALALAVGGTALAAALGWSAWRQVAADAAFADGEGLEARGQTVAAVAAFQRATLLAPGWPLYHERLGRALHRLSMVDAHSDAALGAAVEELMLAGRLAPWDPMPLVDLAIVYSLHPSLAGPPAAADAARRAVALDPNNPVAHRAAAEVALTLGDARGAERAANAALALVPNYGAARLALGQALRLQGRTDEAAAALRQAVYDGPDPAPGLLLLARLYAEADQREQAQAALRQLLELRPGNLPAREDLRRLTL